MTEDFGPVQQVTMKDAFKVCPSCGYRDGFHSAFRKERDKTAWLFVCPSCHGVFDIGLTLGDIPAS